MGQTPDGRFVHIVLTMFQFFFSIVSVDGAAARENCVYSGNKVFAQKFYVWALQTIPSPSICDEEFPCIHIPCMRVPFNAG